MLSIQGKASKIENCYQLVVSTMQNAINRWQFRATVKVKIRSGRQNKLSKTTAHMLAREGNHNPIWLLKKKKTAGSIIRLRNSSLHICLHIQDLHGRLSRRKPYLQPQLDIRCKKYAKEQPPKPKAFWKQVLWANEVKIELFGHNQQWYIQRKKSSNSWKEHLASC